MATFSEFLSSLDPQKKGKQFEYFVKWFLINDPEWKTQVDQIWLWDDYPDRWGIDCGIDLVFKHKNSEIWAVQAKCYSLDYYITKSDVDKFLSESNRPSIHKRLLIATTDLIGPNAKAVCENQELHIVGLGVDINNQPLQNLLKKNRDIRNVHCRQWLPQGRDPENR